MRLSVIICTHNRAYAISGCLESVKTALSNAKPIDAEIIVVDNGSNDNTSAIVSAWAKTCAFPVNLLYEPRKGLAIARNSAIQAARGDILVFTDDDCTLNPDYITRLVHHYATDTVPVLRGGKVELGDPTDMPFTIKLDDHILRMNDIDHPAGFILGANMAMSRTLIDKIGLFDERFGAGALFKSGEDTDYIYRVYRTGMKVEYVPDIIVKHFHGRKDITSVIRLEHGYQIGNGALYMKYVKDWKLLRHFFWDLRNMLRGDPLGAPELGLTYKMRVKLTLQGMLLYIRESWKNLASRQASPPLITRLQAYIHKTLAPLVPESGKFALLDFPDYSNVGDSAIWLGEIAYFTQIHKISPAYVCTHSNTSWDALQNALPEGTIFLSGGGNFGDIWPVHQNFREQVLERFRRHKVVQLPQSLHFSSPEALKRTAAIINAHPDFTLLVRDRKSLAIAKEAFTCRVELCPDMAFCLGILQKPVQPSSRLLLLMRTDVEKTAPDDTAGFPPGTLKADWLTDDPNIWKKPQYSLIRFLSQLGIKILDKHRRLELRYRWMAKARLDRGVRLLSSGESVITDRLHAHILCTLLNIPHIALDNSYGKLSGFIEAWTKDCSIMRSMPTLAEALSSVKEK